DDTTHIWSQKISLKSPEIYRYRYFVCRLLWEDKQKPSNVANSLKEASGVVIVFWESNIVSRLINTRVLPEFYELPVVDFAVRAYHYTEWTRGWVYDATELRLRLCGRQSINMSYALDVDSTLWIRCVPLNFPEMTKRSPVPTQLGCSRDLLPMLSRFLSACDVPHSSFDPYLCGKSRFSETNCKLMNTCNVSDVLVSKLDGVHCLPGLQETKGIPYTDHNFISFSISTSRRAALGFRMELCESKDDQEKLIGYSYLLPLRKKSKILTVPIFSSNNSELGQMRVDTLSIATVRNLKLDMQISFQNHWNWGHSNKSNAISDSGVGIECLYKEIAYVSTNTIFSLLVAANKHVHYLHFEVQLTKEKIPVVFNDFIVHVTFLNGNNEPEFYKANVRDLTVDQLRHLQVTKLSPDSTVQANVTTNHELIPFPTLATCLATLRKDVGFIIQVKYPQVDINGKSEVANYFTEDTVVDSIISIVMDGYEQRKIILTSTEADICVLLQKKQNRFPVVFKSHASSLPNEEVYDFRASSIGAALEFAVSEKLLGVYLSSLEVARDKNIVTSAHRMGLVVFSGGHGTGNPDIRKLLCRNRVNCLETCHVHFDLKPGSHHPYFSLPSSQIYTLYVADLVLNNGCMPLPRYSVQDSVQTETEDHSSYVESESKLFV
ncbi:glycerophosphocholine phosphodiesterase GPCPD1-like isoform X1, partial [Biomphalaria pfeifferi]